MSNWTEEAKGVMKAMDDLSEMIEKARGREGKSKAELEKIGTQLKAVHDKKLVALANDPDFQSLVDPRSGKTNKEWTETIVEQAINQDGEFVGMLGAYYAAQQAAIEAQTDVLNLAERLGTLRTKARLITALLYLAVGEDE